MAKNEAGQSQVKDSAVSSQEGHVTKLREAILKSFGLVFAVFVVALLSAMIGHRYYSAWLLKISPWTQIASAFLILWAVLGQLGFEIETWDGNSLPERINKYWFRILMVFGTYLLMVGMLAEFFR